MSKLNTNLTRGTDHTRVAPTAWGVSYLRTFSDIPFSQEFFDVLNKHIQSQGEPDIATKASRDQLAPQLEARYKLVEKLILESGNTQVVELAAGVATHGLNLSGLNPDLSYVEVDLPGVVKEKLAIIDELGIKLPSNLNICEGNALSEANIRKAIAKFDRIKPLTVVNEGLMRYLTFDEKATLAQMVRNLLTEYGGVWVTPDISLRQALAREDAVATGHTEQLKQTTGIDIDKNLFDDEQHAIRFFENLGFTIERHSFLEVSDALVSPERLGMSKNEVRELNEPCVAFVMRIRS
ncbi:MAG: class I SAM-dependent methyltransferase [Candidatus Saccharibacteria bacterium]|nr:class I SAM-dependent methyltransferase [Candidatus Saccharibacteria bacterium]